jgi:hypothetical protein
MKHETARYVSECDTCRKVKADYMKPGGLLQPLSIPDWKWDNISLGFHCGIAIDCPQVLFNLDERGSTHQIRSLHTRPHQVLS